MVVIVLSVMRILTAVIVAIVVMVRRLIGRLVEFRVGLVITGRHHTDLLQVNSEVGMATTAVSIAVIGAVSHHLAATLVGLVHMVVEGMAEVLEDMEKVG